MLKVSDMVMVNLQGEAVGGATHKPLNAAGIFIHAAIHKARPDVHAICHAHSVYGKAWSVFGKELEMLSQDVCKFYKGQAVYDAYGGVCSFLLFFSIIASFLSSFLFSIHCWVYIYLSLYVHVVTNKIRSFLKPQKAKQ